jgi:hypothetical protein
MMLTYPMAGSPETSPNVTDSASYGWASSDNVTGTKSTSVVMGQFVGKTMSPLAPPRTSFRHQTVPLVTKTKPFLISLSWSKMFCNASIRLLVAPAHPDGAG